MINYLRQCASTENFSWIHFEQMAPRNKFSKGYIHPVVLKLGNIGARNIDTVCKLCLGQAGKFP